MHFQASYCYRVSKAEREGKRLRNFLLYACFLPGRKTFKRPLENCLSCLIGQNCVIYLSLNQSLTVWNRIFIHLDKEHGKEGCRAGLEGQAEDIQHKHIPFIRLTIAGTSLHCASHYGISYKVKARTSTSKKIVTYLIAIFFIVVAWNWTLNISKMCLYFKVWHMVKQAQPHTGRCVNWCIFEDIQKFDSGSTLRNLSYRYAFSSIQRNI